MRHLLLALSAFHLFGSAQALGNERERKPLTIFNDSDAHVIVVVQTPSLNPESHVVVAVPSRTVVYNIRIPVVEDDQFAVAYKAIAAPEGLEKEKPLKVVGVTTLLHRGFGKSTNSTIPVLWYRGPKDMSVGSTTMDNMHMFASPVSTAEAAEWVKRAMNAPRKLDFQKLVPNSTEHAIR